MAKRFTDTEKYRKPFVRGLPGAYKLLWDYLYHDCDCAGIWHVDFEVAQIYIGKDMPINRDEALKLFNADEERIVVLNSGSKWFIKPFIEFQYDCCVEELNVQNTAHRGVIKILNKVGVTSISLSDLSRYDKGASKPLARGYQAPMDKDKDKDKEKGVRGKNKNGSFVPPSVEEVRAYCQERNNGIDAKHFVDYNTARGWLVGRVPAKDWKAMVRTWEANNKSRVREREGVSRVADRLPVL